MAKIKEDDFQGYPLHKKEFLVFQELKKIASLLRKIIKELEKE